MISVTNTIGSTRSIVAAGDMTLNADTTPPAGKGEGFRPHQLLEAAVASCMAITLRMVAMEKGISLEAATVTVELDRSHEEETVFRSKVDLKGALAQSERKLLLATLRRCPVRKTLSKKLAFIDVEVPA